MFEIATNRLVGANQNCFIIAECGQNHNGDIGIAMDMIKKAVDTIGADCVKFQKSDLKSKFNGKALERCYNSVHSYGATYGEHRTKLELTNEQFCYLQKYAQNEGILFTASAMDSVSLEFLVEIDVPFIKIGSGDVNNYPLLELAATKNKPLVVSTGMHDIDVVKTAHDIIINKNSRLCLLHCVSAYPISDSTHINLKVINQYYSCFPSAVIGYSGHELGTEISVAAVTLGAKVLERHLTLDKSMKGTDHSASLEPNEFRNLVDQVRNVEKALSGSGTKDRRDCELACYNKLGKSIVAKHFLVSGTVLTLSCIDIKVAQPFGIEAHHIYKIIGRTVKRDIESDESIQYVDLN